MSIKPVNLKDFADNETVFAQQAGDWLFEEARKGNPMIVYTNKTRKAYSDKVRRHFGYDAETANIGEPMICRQNKGGMVNNEEGIVCGVADSQGRIEIDFGFDKKIHVKPFLEDVNDIRPPKSIAFRFGYAITAHTAQGSEWPTVLVDLDSYKVMSTARWLDNPALEARQWLYTAATRAKTKLIIVKGLRQWLSAKSEAPVAKRRVNAA